MYNSRLNKRKRKRKTNLWLNQAKRSKYPSNSPELTPRKLCSPKKPVKSICMIKCNRRDRNEKFKSSRKLFHDDNEDLQESDLGSKKEDEQDFHNDLFGNQENYECNVPQESDMGSNKTKQGWQQDNVKYRDNNPKNN